MVSVARIRLASRKSPRLFKGIICDDISEFESRERPSARTQFTDAGDESGRNDSQAPNCLGTRRKKPLLPHSNKFECQGRNWPRLQRGHFLALGGHGTFALCNVKEGGIALCNEKASRPPRTQMLVPPFFWRGFFFGPFSTTVARGLGEQVP